jgi:hypothetical protein
LGRPTDTGKYNIYMYLSGFRSDTDHKFLKEKFITAITIKELWAQVNLERSLFTVHVIMYAL